jgi:hypothetical protein
MRRLITASLLTAAAFLMLLGGPVAMAQNSSKSGSSAGSSQTTGGPAQAPVGHRQPRASDLPSEKNGSAKLDAEDAALDRKIKSICRGC